MDRSRAGERVLVDWTSVPRRRNIGEDKATKGRRLVWPQPEHTTECLRRDVLALDPECSSAFCQQLLLLR
jgi:hypothetical protein